MTRSPSPKHGPARVHASGATPDAAPGPPHDPAREAWALMVQMVKAVRMRHLAELDLTLAQMQLLLTIDAGRPAPMNELAGTLGCDASNVTGLVDRLEARGLLERRQDVSDRRVKMVAITSAGGRIQKKLHERWYEPPEPIAALSARDQAALLAILRRASAAAGPAG